MGKSRGTYQHYPPQIILPGSGVAFTKITTPPRLNNFEKNYAGLIQLSASSIQAAGNIIFSDTPSIISNQRGLGGVSYIQTGRWQVLLDPPASSTTYSVVFMPMGMHAIARFFNVAAGGFTVEICNTDGVVTNIGEAQITVLAINPTS